MEELGSSRTRQQDQNGETLVGERSDHRRKRRRKSEKRRQLSSGGEENQPHDDFPEKHKIDVDDLKRRISEEPQEAKDNGYIREEKTAASLRMRQRERKTSKTYDTLSECRKMFRQEMVLLGREVEQFRTVCQNEISKYKRLVLEHRARHQTQKEEGDGELSEHSSLSRTVSAESGDRTWEDMMSVLQTDMDFLSRKQGILDKEQQLLDKEESLSQRQKDLEEYEKEINEVERMLDRRQNMCTKRQTDLANLDDELRELKGELNTTKENLETRGINTEVASQRAKQNWDIVKKNLFEKQTFLENTVQKYRTDLATAQSNITSKDILLTKQQDEIIQLHEVIEKKDIKMNQLETQLTFTLEEARSLEKKFHQILLESESSIIINHHHHGDQSPSTSPPKQILKRESTRTLLPRESHSPRGSLNKNKADDVNGVGSRNRVGKQTDATNSTDDVSSEILNGKSASCVVM